MYASYGLVLSIPSLKPLTLADAGFTGPLYLAKRGNAKGERYAEVNYLCSQNEPNNPHLSNGWSILPLLLLICVDLRYNLWLC